MVRVLHICFQRFALAQLATILALTCIASQALAQQERSKIPTPSDMTALGLEERVLRFRQTGRWFLVQPAPDPTRPAAVLIVLHGGGQSMRRQLAPNAGATRGWPDLARRENVVLLMPNAVNSDTGDAQGDNQNWNDLRRDVARESSADDVGFILGLIDWAHQTYHTDRSRVYVTGASNGGMMTFRLLIEAPETFAAGAAFIAALPRETTSIKQPSKPTPLLIANGTLDPLVIWSGGKIAGNRGETRSVADTVRWWVEANKAAASPQSIVLLPDTDPNDQCTIERREYPAQSGGAVVLTYTMIGGGHNIPSAKYPLEDRPLIRRFIGPVCKDVEGIELAWDFLSKHKR